MTFHSGNSFMHAVRCHGCDEPLTLNERIDNGLYCDRCHEEVTAQRDAVDIVERIGITANHVVEAVAVVLFIAVFAMVVSLTQYAQAHRCPGGSVESIFTDCIPEGQ